MVETMQIDKIIADPSRITLANPAIFNRYAGKLGPIVGCSLHMGNWELAVWPLTAAGADARRSIPIGQQSLRRPVPA